METDGIIEIVRTKNRAYSVRLTDASDWRARALAGRPGLRECLAIMRRIAACIAAGNCHAPSKIDGAVHVAELAIAGLTRYDQADKWRTKIYANEIALLPATVRGWVTGCVTDQSPDGGGQAIGLTEAGRMVLADPPRLELPASDPALVELYETTFDAHAQARGLTPAELETRNAWRAHLSTVPTADTKPKTTTRRRGAKGDA